MPKLQQRFREKFANYQKALPLKKRCADLEGLESLFVFLVLIRKAVQRNSFVANVFLEISKVVLKNVKTKNWWQ